MVSQLRDETDTFFKRFTAEAFYHLMKWMRAEVVFNHADYRLILFQGIAGICKF